MFQSIVEIMSKSKEKYSTIKKEDALHTRTDLAHVPTMEFIKRYLNEAKEYYKAELSDNQDLSKIMDFLELKGFDEKYNVNELLILVNSLKQKSTLVSDPKGYIKESV